MQTSVEEFTLLALEHLPQAVLIAGHDGQVIFRSAAARSLLTDGLDVMGSIRTEQGALINWPQEISNLDISAGAACYRNVTITTRTGGQAVVDVDLTVLCRDFEADNASAVLVVVTNISQRSLLERQQGAADRLAKENGTLARLVHELANPLDGAMRYLDLAESAGSAQVAAHLRGLRKALGQVAAIIAHNRGQAQPKHSLSELIGGAIDAFTLRADAQSVQIKYEPDTDESFETDFRLFQVFCNVIKNSLDAMADGGKVEIAHSRQGRQMVIEFADTGCGLIENDSEKIFEPFYTTKPADLGTGLGLTVSRELLAPLGGLISAANRSGAGLLVTIKLPIPGESE